MNFILNLKYCGAQYDLNKNSLFISSGASFTWTPALILLITDPTYTCVWGEQRRCGNYEQNRHLGSILVVCGHCFAVYWTAPWEKGLGRGLSTFRVRAEWLGLKKDRLWKCCAGSHVEQAFDKCRCARYNRKTSCAEGAWLSERAMIPRESSRWVFQSSLPRAHMPTCRRYTVMHSHMEGRLPTRNWSEWVLFPPELADLVCVQMASDVF